MVILQERIHRGSLFHIMHEGGSYPHLGDILKIMTQIAEGLSFLHARGVVHCYVNSHRCVHEVPSWYFKVNGLVVNGLKKVKSKFTRIRVVEKWYLSRLQIDVCRKLHPTGRGNKS